MWSILCNITSVLPLRNNILKFFIVFSSIFHHSKQEAIDDEIIWIPSDVVFEGQKLIMEKRVDLQKLNDLYLACGNLFKRRMQVLKEAIISFC